MMTAGEQGSGALRVVSVSLGSSSRNHKAEVEILGRKVLVERIGVDGDYNRARAMIAELDGKVDAIGLGGTDLYLVAGNKRFVIEQSRRLAQAARVTPVVDGSGLKNTLEREAIRWLVDRDKLQLKGKKVLVVSAVDRFGMAEALAERDCQVIFGDMIFALGIPIPLRSLRTIQVLAVLLMPILRRLPISVLYPTGKDQETANPKYARFFAWADIVAGDFHYIRRYMPADMSGKIIITNTATADDVSLLRERGVDTLITTTPELQGRSFGTNVVEGILVALAGKAPEQMEPSDYLDLLQRIGWQPRVTRLANAD